MLYVMGSGLTANGLEIDKDLWEKAAAIGLTATLSSHDAAPSQHLFEACCLLRKNRAIFVRGMVGRYSIVVIYVRTNTSFSIVNDVV